MRIDNGGNLVIYAADKSDAGRYQCAAENVASSRLSRPVRLRVNEEPAFVTAPPATKSALAGHDLVIECQVRCEDHIIHVFITSRGSWISCLSHAKISHS